MLCAPVLHQQALVSLTPESSSHVLNINTAGSKHQVPIFGAGRKRNFDEVNGLDEDAYTRRYIASESSVFFRNPRRSLRSFLWRVLDNGRLLEIQNVDLVHDAKSATRDDCRLIFRIEFSNSIIKNGVALADPDGSDALECFVLTTAGELFTITIKRDLLARETAPRDFDASACFKRYSPSALTHRHAYRFTAISSLELLITLHDGGFMRLDRQAGENGSQWRESLFNEHTWGNTLRGMISLKRQQTVRYGHLDLSSSAIAAIAQSPDGKYIWSVSLSHELSAWDTQTGKAVYVVDLLGGAVVDDAKKQHKFVMSAEQGTLIQVVAPPPPAHKSSRSSQKMHIDEGFAYYLVIQSPKEHEFKIFGVSSVQSVEGRKPHLEDLRPDVKLVPPIDALIQTNVWHLEEFFVQPGPGWQDTSFWIRARSSTFCRIFKTTANLYDSRGRPTELVHNWAGSWTIIDPGSSTSDRVREQDGFPGDLEHVAGTIPTVSEKWVDYLFSRHFFSTECLESAVHIYCKAHRLSPAVSKGFSGVKTPIKQRLLQAIENKVTLGHRQNEQQDLARYASDLQAEWKTFFSLLIHLHGKRIEPTGLAYDAHDQIAWSVCADLAGPVRRCSPLELLALNEHLVFDDVLDAVEESLVNKIFKDDDEITIAQIMAAAQQFRHSLSPDFRDKLTRTVVNEALIGHDGTVVSSSERLEALYTENEFSAEVTDDEFQALTDLAENFGGLGTLDATSLLAVLERLDELDEKLSGKDTGKSLCRFGDRFTLEVVRSTMESKRAIVLDLLNLVVFMIGDLDQVDLHPDFVARTGELYDAIMSRLRQIELIIWLSSRVVPDPATRDTTIHMSEDEDQTIQGILAEESRIPLLLRLFVNGWRAISKTDCPLDQSITRWSKGWIHEIDLSNRWNELSAFVFASLLKDEYYNLANEFTRFVRATTVDTHSKTLTSWLSYLEGRYYLATGDLALSSVKFRSAADDMGAARGISGLDRANLLSPDQQSYFGTGSDRYFQHVAALYETQRHFSYVAEFAALALEQGDDSIDLGSSLADIDRRKANKDSPVASRIEDTMEEIRILKLRERGEEIRNRLFNALVHTGRFREAWDCLVLLGDTRRSNLVIWIKKVIEADAIEVLLEVTLRESSDALTSEVDTILLNLAKKSLVAGSGPPYHRVLYAFRTQRSDFRGAAEILYESMDRIQAQSKYQQDPEDETLLHAYVLLINTLACCGDDDAWLLAEPADSAVNKRKLVTLADVRRDYATELDRRSDVLMGRYPLVGGGDDMDVM